MWNEIHLHYTIASSDCCRFVSFIILLFLIHLYSATVAVEKELCERAVFIRVGFSILVLFYFRMWKVTNVRSSSSFYLVQVQWQCHFMPSTMTHTQTQRERASFLAYFDNFIKLNTIKYALTYCYSNPFWNWWRKIVQWSEIDVKHISNREMCLVGRKEFFFIFQVVKIFKHSSAK